MDRDDFDAAFGRIREAGLAYGDSFHAVGNQQGPSREPGVEFDGRHTVASLREERRGVAEEGSRLDRDSQAMEAQRLVEQLAFAGVTKMADKSNREPAVCNVFMVYS
jgi:hypothetical protein